MANINKKIPPTSLPLVEANTTRINPIWYRFFLDFSKEVLEVGDGAGVVIGTGTGTTITRNIAAGSTKITVTNGDGVAGNPTVDVDETFINHNNLSNYSANEHIDWTNATDNLYTTGTITLDSHIDIKEEAVPSAPSATYARVFAVDQGGFSTIKYLDSAGLPHEITRDGIHVVRNVTGSTITKGSWVYINGSNGTYPTVALAKADSTTTLPVFGIVLADITNNSFGQVMTVGDAESLDTSSFTDGDVLYISNTTAGTVTTTKTSPTSQRVGVVVKGNTAGAGIINVAIAGVISINDSWTLIETYTVGASAATHDLTDADIDLYDDLLITFDGISKVSGAELRISFSTDAGSTFENVSYFNTASARTAYITNGVSSTNNAQGSLRLTNTGGFNYVSLHQSDVNASTGGGLAIGTVETTADIDLIRFQDSGGNIDGGTIKIYGK